MPQHCCRGTQLHAKQLQTARSRCRAGHAHGSLMTLRHRANTGLARRHNPLSTGMLCHCNPYHPHSPGVQTHTHRQPDTGCCAGQRRLISRQGGFCLQPV